MAIYYVRPDGNDANTGTGSATNQAWQTIQKALGATSGLVGGDIVYIAPGRYVELVTIGITSPSSQVRIVGDPTASQFSGLSAGYVRHTNVYANGAVLGRQILIGTSINNLSFENIFYQNAENSSSGTTRLALVTSQNTQFKKCVFEDATTDSNHIMLYLSPATTSAINMTIDSCIFIGGATQLRTDGQVVADNSVVKNCLFVHGKQGQLNITGTQTQILNCTFMHCPVTAINSNPYNGLASTVKNCLFVNVNNIAFFISSNSTSWTYNRWVASGGASNVTTTSGTNSANIGTADVEYGYNLLQNIQAIWNPGTTIGSANTSFGNATSAPTVDMFGVAWSGTSPDAGAITYRNLQTITPIYQPTERNASAITIAPGSTSQSIELYLGATGLTASTSGLSARYNRTRTASVSIPLVARTIGQAWTSGGFAEVDATNMPGVYRLDLPDAALAAGADDVTVVVRGAFGTNGAVMTVKLSSGGLTSAQTASAVWDAARASYATAGTFGEYVNAELVTPITSAALVRMGPFEVKADGLGASDPLDIQKGAQHGVDIQCVDGNGNGIDITSATVTAKVYNSGGSLVDTYACTATYAADGRATFTIDTTVTNTVGTYTATVTRTTGASDTQVFGPLRIYVRDI